MRTASSSGVVRESLRYSLLLIAAIWAASPLCTRLVVGGGDAVWYQYQIADAVTQFRAGFFPVFTGQSHYSFNGAIHPIRTAPYCQYFAGLIDLLTGHRLSFANLLHLAAVLSVVGASFSTYAALVWLAPDRRGRATLLSIVYIWSPGVLGLPVAQDLYMSTMAIPWVPVAIAAAVQMNRTRGDIAPVILGISLGLLWWAHPPIAVWTTFIVAVMVSGHCFASKDKRVWVKQPAVMAALLCLVAAYPLVSVLSLREAGEKIVPIAHDRQELLNEISGTFPALLLPLNLEQPLLTFMQPGYGVLGALLVAAGASFFIERDRRWIVWVLVGCAGLYLAMILPVPGFTTWIWHRVPDLVANMTSIWPMQRLSLIVAAVAMVSLQMIFRRGAVAGQKELKLTWVLGAIAFIWAALQAEQLRTLAHHRTNSVAETVRTEFDENVNVSAYCYQQLPQRPAYFIHGVTDPAQEMHLLDLKSGLLVQSNRAAIEESSTEPWIPTQVTRTNNSALFNLTPELTLQPGVRYLLTFDFSHEDVHGVLRFIGPQMQRVYALPSAGDAEAFGTGAKQEKSLALWTSQTQGPEQIRIEFISPEGEGIGALQSFGRTRLTPIQSDKLPIQITSWLPLQMKVQSSQPALLETVRMFIPGWTAIVNGKPGRVMRSREGLVAVEVPAGASQVEVSFRGPLLLRISFWISLATLLAILVGGSIAAAQRMFLSSNRAAL